MSRCGSELANPNLENWRILARPVARHKSATYLFPAIAN